MAKNKEKLSIIFRDVAIDLLLVATFFASFFIMKDRSALFNLFVLAYQIIIAVVFIVDFSIIGFRIDSYLKENNIIKQTNKKDDNVI